MQQLLLNIKDLSYSYPQRDTVLQEVSFSLSAGQKLALVGDNGAGKTTLLQLLVGLLRPRSGEIWALGEVRRKERDFIALRQEVGFVFQDPDDQLFCPSVLEDMMFGPLNQGMNHAQAKTAALALLQDLKLSHLAPRMAAELSGGEKRLVTLACVLVMQPKILLLDEPTNALDNKARQRLIELLKSLPQAMLIISHDSDFLDQLGVQRLVLQDGAISGD